MTEENALGQCRRCGGQRVRRIVAEAGGAITVEILCPECFPTIQEETKRRAAEDLSAAMLRIGTQMAHLCMKYGSVRGTVDARDRERMLDLDESWHQVLVELAKLKAKELHNAQDDH